MEVSSNGWWNVSPVDEETWSHHAMIRDIVDGELKPFDQYQGPYVLTPNNQRLWICVETDQCNRIIGYTIYNSSTDEQSSTFLLSHKNEGKVKAILEGHVREVYEL